ncbi:MAG TPA: MFS transporter, partial [Solirubrobacteraceae bacterium]
GSWAARIPWVQEHLDLSDGELGAALLAPAVGGVLTMTLVGRLTTLVGSRVVARLVVPGWCAVLALPALMPSFWTLAASLLLFGVLAGATDVAMNAQGVVVERRRAHPLLSHLHGLWSLGALLGAAVGAAFAAADVAATLHLAIVAVALLLAAEALAVPHLAAHDPTSAPAADERGRPPARGMVALGLVGLGALFVEAAAADWSAVYVSTTLSAGPALGAVAFAAFASAMTVGRLLGNRGVVRFGAVRLTRVSGALAGTGLTVMLIVPAPAVGIVSFTLLGLGIACIVPLIFGAAAARQGSGDPGPSIAFVATISYPGWLAAPALIGGIAEVVSLPAAMGLVAAITFALAFAAPVMRPRHCGDASPTSPK